MSTDFFWAYLAEDTGNFDNVTSHGRVIVEGVSAQQSWWLSLNGGDTWVEMQGTSFTLAQGQHNVLKRSEYDSPYLLGKIKVDQTVPDAPTAEFSSNGQYVSGVVEAYATVKIQAEINGQLMQLGSATTGADGRYNIRINTLSNAENVQVIAFDQALNSSKATYWPVPIITLFYRPSF
jgi:hypothetical protein